MMEQHGPSMLLTMLLKIKSSKISYHTIMFLAGLLIFFFQLIVLSISHGEHVRHLQQNASPFREPCPAVPTVQGTIDSGGRRETLDTGLDGANKVQPDNKVDSTPDVVRRPGAQLNFKIESKLRYSSSDATVLAMAQGYKLETHQRFVGSLRKSGFTGNILLATEPILKRGVEEYLVHQNVTILKLNYTECEHKILEDNEVKTHKDKECNTCIAPYQNVKVSCLSLAIL